MSAPSLKNSLLARQPSVGCWLVQSSAANAEALAHCGFDWLLIDQEHAPNTTADLLAQLRAIDAARAHGARVDVVARMPGHDPAAIKTAMDCGAASLMFPNVENAQQAQDLARAMRYAQRGNGGQRGVAGIVRAARYGLDDTYIAEANQHACTIVQIETPRGVDQAAAIAAVEGVDCLFVGPADLSFGLGHPGDLEHPVVREAIDHVRAAADAAGRALGMFAASPQQWLQWRRAGFHMIALHSDVAWLTRGASAALAEVRAA
jgi:2-dehydro-3-deoxyglucarate aldolase